MDHVHRLICQIISVSLIAPLILGAMLESFLLLAAFCYCLAKAYQKADCWSQKLLAAVMTVVIITLRYVPHLE